MNKSHLFATLFSMISLMQSANGNIIVSNASPSQISWGDHFYLDVDNDGTEDFHIYFLSPPMSIWIEGTNTNNGIATDVFYALALNPGESVSGAYFRNNPKIYEHGSSDANFQLNVMSYLGLKFRKGGQDHFGYVAVKPASNGQSLYLYQYGYETKPGVNITAGAQQMTPVESHPSPSDFKITLFNDVITVEGSRNIKIESLQLIGMNGQVLSATSLGESEIDISGLPSQQYFLAIYYDNSKVPVIRKLIYGF